MNSLTAQINALQEPLRQYVHDLETDADPAGEKMRLLQLEENVAGLTAEIERLTRENAELTSAIVTEALAKDRLRAALGRIAGSGPRAWASDLQKIAREALSGAPANRSPEKLVVGCVAGRCCARTRPDFRHETRGESVRWLGIPMQWPMFWRVIAMR